MTKRTHKRTTTALTSSLDEDEDDVEDYSFEIIEGESAVTVLDQHEHRHRRFALDPVHRRGPPKRCSRAAIQSITTNTIEMNTIVGGLMAESRVY